MKKKFTKGSNIVLTAALFMMISFVSCYHENKDIVQKPDKLFPHDTMVSLIVDINLIDGIESFNKLNGMNNNDLKKEYYERLFLKYGITENELKQNMEYYSSQYDEMQEIYDEAIARLNKIKDDLKEKEMLEKQNEKPVLPPAPVWHYDSIAATVDSLTEKNRLPEWIRESSRR
jgi:arsenate reductase-like glutaredoxin family protein